MCEEKELAKDVEMADGDAKAELQEEWKAKRAEVKQARSNLAKNGVITVSISRR